MPCSDTKFRKIIELCKFSEWTIVQQDNTHRFFLILYTQLILFPEAKKYTFLMFFLEYPML